jgi:predicted RNA-binding Zn ribbon-like protein
MAEPVHVFDRCAGHVALDFANAMGGRHTDAPVDYLPSYRQLLEFARQCELLPAAQLAHLARRAAEDPAGAAAALRRAVELRETLYRLFAATARGRMPDAGDLALLNRAVGRMQIGRDFEWQWAAGPDSLDAMLGPIVRAALDLLMSKRRERVRVCAADDCVWVFLDTSKNRSRRWCDMKQCGNRNKVRRFHRRQP